MNNSAPDSPHEETPEAEPDGIAKDSFYHGTIQRMFPRKNGGVVETSSGRKIPFSFECLHLLGPVKRPQELREGLVVGFDMGWTSDGLKVTKIKTYRKVGDDVASPKIDVNEKFGDH